MHDKQEFIKSIAVHELLTHKLEVDLFNFQEYSVKVVRHVEVGAGIYQNELKSEYNLQDYDWEQTEKCFDDACFKGHSKQIAWQDE